MAVGDVVNGISAANTILTFQPSLGVECIITSAFTETIAGVIALYNGVNFAYNNAAAADAGVMNIKIFINNSIYLYLSAMGAAAYGAYSGLQIK